MMKTVIPSQEFFMPALQTWVVAFNLPTRTWDSGGAEGIYDRAFYDVYRVEANERAVAERQAKEQRRRQQMTPAQRAFVEGLFSEFQDGADPLAFTVEITDANECRLVPGLVRKGLLTLVSENDHAKEVKLTFAGLNGGPRDPVALSAVRRAVQTPPCSSPAVPRPRVRP